MPMASIYDDWYHGLCQGDDDRAGQQKQAALLSYLNGKTTADVAAHEWTKQVTNSGKRSAELPWSFLIEAAEEFPQAHDRLVELLDVIAQLQTTEEGDGRKLRGNHPELVFELRDAFSGKSNVLVWSMIESRADVMYCRYRECLIKKRFDCHR